MPDRWRRRPLPAAALLVAVCALAYGYRLPGTAFRGLYDDVNRAIIARAMVEQHDWLAPRVTGEASYYKPPLTYWAAASLYAVTGRRDEWPASLASALAMLAAVLLAWTAGRALVGARAALLGALMLATAFLWVGMARQPLIDTVMMVGFMAAMTALARIAAAPGRSAAGWWLLVFAGLALATLAKGPVTVPVLLLAALPLWLDPPRRLPPWPSVALGVLLFAAIVLPWYLAVAAREPAAAAVWRSELLGRFGSGRQFLPWTQHAWWFYVPDLANFLPWLPLLPAGLVLAWRRRADAGARLLIWWALGGFAFFSFASASKRSYYLLPIYPALALLGGAAWDAAIARAGGGADSGGPAPPGRLLAGGIAATAGCVVVAGLAAAGLPLRYPGVRPAALFVGVGAVVAAMGVRALTLRARRPGGAFGWTLGGVLLGTLLYHGHLVPPLNAYLSGREFLREARPLIGAQPLAICGYDYSLPIFYLGRNDFTTMDAEALRQATAAGRGGVVITSAAQARRQPGLKPLLVRELHSPFGQTRTLGLYALPAEPDATSRP